MSEQIEGRILALFRKLEFANRVPAGTMCYYCGALSLAARGDRPEKKGVHDPECRIERVIYELTHPEDVVDSLTFGYAQEALEGIEHAGGNIYTGSRCPTCDIQAGVTLKRHEDDCELAKVLCEVAQITGKPIARHE